MMWWHGEWNAWAWFGMSVSMAVFWGLLIWGLLSLVRSARRPPERENDPVDVLRERFARGEIDEEEFQRRRELIGR